MKGITALSILRLTVAFILIMHSVPSIFSGGVNDFGRLYLDAKGFAPMGVFLAWAIKLSHSAAAICILLNRYVKIASLVTMLILVVGIILVHGPEGWFVVGGGRNGVEFSVLLIVVLLVLGYPEGFRSRKS